MSKRKIAMYAAIAIIPLIAALFIAGFDPNYELGNYVTTDNAQGRRQRRRRERAVGRPGERAPRAGGRSGRQRSGRRLAENRQRQ